MFKEFLDKTGLEKLIIALNKIFSSHEETIEKIHKDTISPLLLNVNYEGEGLEIKEEWGYDEFLK